MEKTQAVVNGVTITLTQEQLDFINQQSAKKPKEDRFLELISGVDISRPRVDFGKYPNRIFWFDSNGNYMFEYDWKNGYFWVNYNKIWSVFYGEYAMEYTELEAFMMTMVEEHFKLKGVTPSAPQCVSPSAVEEHFKLKGVTPSALHGPHQVAGRRALQT